MILNKIKSGNTRRRFIIACMQFSMAVMFQSYLQAQEREQDGKLRFRIGTCDWSVRMALTRESFYYGKRIGLQGIQYSFDEAGKGLDLREEVNRQIIRQTVKETGVGISSLGIALLNKVPYATTDEGEQLVIDCIETMAKLKEEATLLNDPELAARVSPNIVLLGFFNKGDINGKPDLIEKVIEKLKRLAPKAEEHGIVLGLETLLNEKDHRYIIDSVGSPAVKVYYDTGNAARMGYDIYKEMESLGTAYICEIHIKENGNLLGRGDIDFEKVKTTLEAIQYKGWLILEGSTPKGMSREEGCKYNEDYAQKLFNS